VCKSTDSGEWRPLEPVELKLLTEAVRARGLHLTAQRRAVCEAVFGCPGHICAEHVLAVVRERWADARARVNKTTVYRTLDLLVDLELVSEHKCGDGPAQYEPASRGHHSHAICRRCGSLQNLDPAIAAELGEQLRTRHGFQADLESYPIIGLCASCRVQR
jgi:Fur family ferric uptake transcriptional regulator